MQGLNIAAKIEAESNSIAVFIKRAHIIKQYIWKSRCFGKLCMKNVVTYEEHCVFYNCLYLFIFVYFCIILCTALGTINYRIRCEPVVSTELLIATLYSAVVMNTNLLISFILLYYKCRVASAEATTLLSGHCRTFGDYSLW